MTKIKLNYTVLCFFKKSIKNGFKGFRASLPRTEDIKFPDVNNRWIAEPGKVRLKISVVAYVTEKSRVHKPFNEFCS